VEAVEADPLKRKTLLANAGLSPQRIQCRFIAAELYIRRARQGKPFNLIFCDPPFPYQYKTQLIEGIAGSPLMDGSTLLLIHRPREENLESTLLVRKETKEYGRSRVDFFSK
jgi:16S rRNA G966 N2-methylase RsmD